jgi:hypothetical protein
VHADDAENANDPAAHTPVAALNPVVAQ